MMVAHGCLIACFVLIFPRHLNAYRALSADVDDYFDYFDTLEKQLEIFDAPEVSNIQSRAASVHKNDEKVHFGYEDEDPDSYGPQNWGKISKNCDGKLQSPVDIESTQAKRLYTPALTIGGFDTIPSTIMMANNGHSALLRLFFKDKSHVTLSGGALCGSYVLDNIHWHWGKRDNAGSEHALDGKRFAAEMHLVFYSYNFSSPSEAIVHPGGLTVVAFFYDLNNKTALHQRFVHLLSKIVEPDTTHVETKQLFTIHDLLRGKITHHVTYEGSLTSPMCSEGVIWIVAKRRLSITAPELQEFRKLKDENGHRLEANDRPLQKLNGRNFYLH